MSDGPGLSADELEIGRCERALSELAPGAPDRPGLLLRLAALLRERHAQRGDLDDANRAIELYRQIAERSGAGSGPTPGALHGLGGTLRERYLRTGNPGDLDRAIEVCERAALQSAPDSRDRAPALYELGSVLYCRRAQSQTPDDLERAVEVLKQALALLAPDHPLRARCAHGLGLALWERHLRFGYGDDLSLLFELYGDLIARPTPPGSERWAHLYQLGLATWQKYVIGADTVDLDRAIELYEQARVEAPSADWPDRTGCVRSLVVALRERYGRLGDLADLARAVGCCEELLGRTPIGTPGRQSLLGDLAGVLRDRHQRTGSMDDLVRAIAFGEQAVAEVAPEAGDAAELVRQLGVYLHEHSRLRVEVPHRLAELERAIVLYDRALADTPLGTPERPMLVVQLADAWWEHHGTSGKADSLDRTVDLYQEALAESPIGSPSRPGLLCNSGMQLLQRAALRDDSDDLERAILLLEQAAAQVSPDAPDRARYAGLLADALQRRFSRNMDRSDLDRAIQVYERALQDPPIDPFQLSVLQRGLAEALMSRYWLSKDRADLDRSIHLHDQSLAALPPSSPNRAGGLAALALALQARHRDAGDPADLARAIEVFEADAASTSPDSPEWPGVMSNLAHALQDRCETEHRGEDGERALRILQDVVARVPGGSPGRAQLLDNLGTGLQRRYRQTRDPTDLRLAVAAWEEAWWLLQGTFVNLSVAYKVGRERVWNTLHARLVAALLELSDAGPDERDDARRRALVVVESGKSRLLTELVGRGDLPAPPAVAALALRERQLLAELTTMDMAALAESDAGVDGPIDPDERRRRVEELQALWTSIEQVSTEAAEYVGLRRGDYLSWDAIARWAEDVQGEVALLSVFVADDSTTLFMLRPGWKTPEVVVSAGGARQWEHVQRLLFHEVARSFGSDDVEETWDAPVLSLLRQARAHLAGAERVVVAPMAEGHVLPWNLLAERAGWRDRDGRPPAVTMLPALGLLPRLRLRQRAGGGRNIVVGNPTSDLTHAEEEARSVGALVGADPLIGPGATTDRVLDGLAEATVVHLAAHAAFVGSAPLDSGVLLADGVLTARQVMQTTMRADVLVLSGCETGLVDVREGDELIGMTQAFLQAGARALVVSLWQVNDAAAARMMTTFHKARLDGQSVAAALWSGIDAVRSDDRLSHPYYWAAFVSIGAG